MNSRVPKGEPRAGDAVCPAELLGIFQGTLEDEPGHWVDIHRPWPRSRDVWLPSGMAPAASERVQHSWARGRRRRRGSRRLRNQLRGPGSFSRSPMKNAPGRFFLHLLHLTRPLTRFRWIFSVPPRPAMRSRIALRVISVARIGEQRGDQRSPRRPPGACRAGQICSVEMCPCRTFFSCTESSEVCLRGKATSIRRLSVNLLLHALGFWLNPSECE